MSQQLTMTDFAAMSALSKRVAWPCRICSVAQLNGLQSDKGTHTQKGFFAKKKSSAMKHFGLG